MSLPLDHIFIWVDDLAAADALLEAGFQEGPGRVHHGQGTANRKFYWNNFFLEFLALNDAEEFAQQAVVDSGLPAFAERAGMSGSPFGVCFLEHHVTAEALAPTHAFAPDYLPSGTSMDIRFEPEALHAPWMVRLPFPTPDLSAHPKDHTLGGTEVHGFEWEGSPTDLRHLYQLTAASQQCWVAKNNDPFLWVHLAPGWKSEVRMDGLPVGFRY